MFGFEGPNLQDRACLPLCTLRPSMTNPRNFTCGATPGRAVCGTQTVYTDGSGNAFSTCTSTSGLGGPCERFAGYSCGDSAHHCAFGLCTERLGATCTATTVCSRPGHRCVANRIAAAGGGTTNVALCFGSCELAGAGSCGADAACHLTLVTDSQGTQTATSACRWRSGNLGQHSDSSDAIGLGHNEYACADGLRCTPSLANSYEQAWCTAYCDPMNPGMTPCPAPAVQCNPFSSPAQAFGYCF